MVTSIGYVFNNPALERQALRHRSAGTPHNERLEFLGDAIVNLIVADALYVAWPTASEGDLTRARSELVRESALAQIARDLNLGDQLELGSGELKSGGFRRDSILSDALEALVGAIYLDAGFETCRRVVLPWFAQSVTEQPAARVRKDAKTQLQEWLQARQKPRPSYVLVDGRGPDHERTFRVQCQVNDPDLTVLGEGGSVKAAEQAAAELLLEQLSNR